MVRANGPCAGRLRFGRARGAGWHIGRGRRRGRHVGEPGATAPALAGYRLLRVAFANDGMTKFSNLEAAVYVIFDSKSSDGRRS